MSTTKSISRAKTSDKPRWVIAEIIKTGNPAAQYPLPVLKQGIRVLFEVETPCIVPDYFLVGVGGIPVWGKDKEGNTVMKSEEYNFHKEDIPDEYQSLEGIQKFVAECATPGHELNEKYGPIEVGVNSMPPQMQ